MSRPTVTCSVCGRMPDAEESLLTWSRDTDARERRTSVCPACTRDNVRAIEAKLDQQWW